MYKQIVVFDLDHTLYKGDSSIDFLLFFIKKKPFYFFVLFYQSYYFVLYKLRIISLLEFKSQFFIFLTFLNEENRNKLINNFWNNRKEKHFNQDLLKRIDYFKGRKIEVVIASASLQLIISVLKQKLGIDVIVATELEIVKNKVKIFENCRGEVKIKKLKESYGDFFILEAYSDNSDDIDLLNMASKGYVVKSGKIECL
jgi:phosphatidylglycerophosphatase C